jgi:hypothetical protein
MYQLAVIYCKQALNILTFYIPRPSKIYQNWDFWFENVPSGANHTIASYNASVVNFYKATGSLARFENQNIIFYF